MFSSLPFRYITRRPPTLSTLSIIRTMAISKHVVAKEADFKDGEK